MNHMTRTRKLTTAALGIASLTLGVGAFTPSTATTCASTYGCFWEGYNFQTYGSASDRIQFTKWIPYLRDHYYGSSGVRANDNASSGHNNTSARNIYAFMDPNCTGYYFTRAPGWQDTNFNNGTPSGHNFNDELSSVAFGNYLDECKA